MHYTHDGQGIEDDGSPVGLSARAAMEADAPTLVEQLEKRRDACLAHSADLGDDGAARAFAARAYAYGEAAKMARECTPTEGPAQVRGMVPQGEYDAVTSRLNSIEDAYAGLAIERDKLLGDLKRRDNQYTDSVELLRTAALDLVNARKERDEAVATAERLLAEHQVLTAKAVECGRAFSDGRLAEHQRKGAEAERERLAKVFDERADKFDEEVTVWLDGQPDASDCYNAGRCKLLALAYRGAAAECRKVSA